MFVLYPTCQNLRPEVFARDNFLTELMAWFYTTDTSTNVCPSLHVCGSLAAAFGLVDTKRFSAPGRRAVILLIAMTICVSTVFVKQHSILDMLWGFGFSGVAWMAKKLQNSSESPSLHPARWRDTIKKKERKGSLWKHTNIARGQERHSGATGSPRCWFTSWRDSSSEAASPPASISTSI
jgi:hypothetical protein